MHIGNSRYFILLDSSSYTPLIYMCIPSLPPSPHAPPLIQVLLSVHTPSYPTYYFPTLLTSLPIYHNKQQIPRYRTT